MKLIIALPRFQFRLSADCAVSDSDRGSLSEGLSRDTFHDNCADEEHRSVGEFVGLGSYVSAVF